MIDPLTSSFAFSELWGLSKSVLQKLKSIKNAPKELRILQDEIERFNSHIDDVKDVVSQLNHDDRCSRRIDEAATHCMDVLEPIDGLLRSYSTERCSVGKRFVLRTKAGFRLEGLKSKVAALEKPQRDLELALSTAMVQITARNACTLRSQHTLLTEFMFQTDDPPAQKSISSVQTFAPHTSKDQDTARMRTQCSLRVRSVEEASELPGIIKSHLERSAPIHARVKAMALHELSKAAHGINFHGENEQLLDANVLVRRSTGLSISLRMPWWLKTYIIHFGLAQGPFGAMNWGLQIHCQNIIPESSPVFRACAAADVVEVRRLFLDAKASPFDVDLMGRSLLHYAIRERLNEGKEIGEQTVMVVRFLIHCGTGAASGLSPIVQSHSLLSEDYRMAASLIAGEIKTARSFGNNHLAYGAYWLEQSDRLCGPDPYIDILKSMDPETLANTAYASTFKSELVEDVNTINNLNAIARLCINTAGSDPFESTNLCWELWRQLGCNEPALPLDLPLLHQHQWPVLETLLESNASQLLYDLMTVNCCNSMFSILDDMYARNLEQKYRVMQVLSSGGMLQREYIPDLPLNTADTCDSDYNPLIRMFLSEASKTSCCKRRQRSMFRKYCHEMLRLLLEVEEHPRVLLTDSELLEINRITTTRSLTCIAAEGGLLDVWNSALVDAGKDGNGIVDEWLFSDFSLLFEEESIVNGPTYLEREWHCSRCESVARGGMQDSWSGAIDDNTNKNEGMTTLGRMTQLGWTVLSTARYFV